MSQLTAELFQVFEACSAKDTKTVASLSQHYKDMVRGLGRDEENINYRHGGVILAIYSSHRELLRCLTDEEQETFWQVVDKLENQMVNLFSEERGINPELRTWLYNCWMNRKMTV